MEHNQSINVTGEVTATLYDANGTVKQTVHIPNLVVTAGKGFIASRMIGTTPAVMSHMGVGTSSAAAADANTTLGAQAGSRASATASVSGREVTYSATFAAGVGTGALVEAGIFNAATSGTMLCRTTFNVINKGAEDSLTINWKVTIN